MTHLIYQSFINYLIHQSTNLPLTMVQLGFVSNYIKLTPLSFSLLENVKYANWERNPIQFPPKAILSNAMKSTMNYLQPLFNGHSN